MSVHACVCVCVCQNCRRRKFFVRGSRTQPPHANHNTHPNHQVHTPMAGTARKGSTDPALAPEAADDGGLAAWARMVAEGREPTPLIPLLAWAILVGVGVLYQGRRGGKPAPRRE